MRSKNNTLDLHKTLAHEIEAAKKSMFRRHREGMPLREAAIEFCVDMEARFRAVVPDHEQSSASVASKREADDAPAHTPDILTDEQVDYAISQMVSLAETGPNSGLAALVKHFRDLAVTGRAEEAKEDAEKCLGALASVGFERASRGQFLEDMKIDVVGENGADEDDEERVQPQRVEQTAAARQRLADAIVETFTNKTAPVELRNRVGDFIVETTNGLFDEMRKDPVIIERALQRLQEPA